MGDGSVDLGSTSCSFDFFHDDGDLQKKIARFVGGGLVAGQSALLVTTPQRWASCQGELRRGFVDLERARERGMVEVLDLDVTVMELLHDGVPNRERFHATYGPPVARLCHGGAAVRVYCELVNALVQRGEELAAVKAHSYFGELARSHGVSLRCAFVRTFESGAYRAVVKEAVLADVVPPLAVEDFPPKKPSPIERHLRTELERADLTKQEFLATLSHELRTPLHGILGWVRMLRAGGLSDERQAHALETVERNANAQAALVEDLLDESRIATGNLRLEVAPVDLAEVIGEAVDAVTPAANLKRLAIATNIPDGAMRGDRARLQQVFWNLLANAVKFGTHHVSVDVTKRDGELQVIVSDDGEGIAPEFLPLVFEPFRQADGAPTRRHGGLGLGLAITKHLVELHGGRIQAASDGAGKGATFRVTLPVNRKAPLVRPPRVTPVPVLVYPPELAGLRALVVEPDPEARERLVELLAPCKGTIVTANDAPSAIACASRHRPDVVIADVEAAGGLTDALARIPAVALVDPRGPRELPGFAMCVPKPVEPSELLAVLASLVAMFPRSASH